MGRSGFGGGAGVSSNIIEESCSCNRAVCFLSSSVEPSAVAVTIVAASETTEASPPAFVSRTGVRFTGAATTGADGTATALGGGTVVTPGAGTFSVLGRTGFTGTAGEDAVPVVARTGATRSDGKRMPQKPTAGSVNSNST